MKALRILGNTFTIIVLTIVLFLTAIVWGIAPLLSSFASLKQAMVENDVYSAVVQDAIRGSDNALEKLTRSNRDYANKVTDILTPYAEQGMNKGFEGIFTWLSGGSDDFTFAVDFTPARQEVIELTSKYNFQSALTQELQSDAVWTTLTSEFESAIGDNEEAKSQFAPIKPFYPLLPVLAWVLPLVALGLIGLIIRLAPTLRKGSRRSGIVLTTVGALLATLSILGAWAIGRVSISSFATAGRTAFLKTVFEFGSSALGVILWVGIIILVIGVAAIVVPVFMKPKDVAVNKS